MTDLKRIADEMRTWGDWSPGLERMSVNLHKWADQLDALAGAEPVATFVQSPYGNYPELKWRAGYTARIGDCVYSSPQPARITREACDVVLSADEADTLRQCIGDVDAQSIRLQIGDGHSGHGLYVSSAEYPDEGSTLVCPIEVQE